MSDWTSDARQKFEQAEELELASLRADGTLRRPVTIWVVRVGDDLYVRAVNGRDGAWFHGAQERHEGRISGGGVEQVVRFIEVDAADAINGQIDAAYRAKYHRYAASIINTVVSPRARAATLKLAPR